MNVWKKRLGLSSPSPLGQPLRHHVRCVWRTCSSSVPLLLILYRTVFYGGTKSFPVWDEHSLHKQWRIQGRGPGGPVPTPLIFRPNWDPKSQKNLFWRPPFPLSKGLDPAMISDGEGKELRTLQQPALLSRSNITGSDTFVKTSFLLTYIICNSQNLCYCNLDSYSPSKKHNTLCRLKNRTDFFFQINRSVQNFTCLGNQSDAWWLIKSCYYKNHNPIRKTTAQNWYPVSPEVPE